MSTLLVSHTPTLSSYKFGYSGTLLGQTFIMPSGYDRINSVKIPLRRLGTVSGNCTVSIYATSGGVPTGSSLGNATYTASSISTSGSTYYEFTFGTAVAVSGGSRYTVVFDGNGTSSSNTVVWWTDNANSYANGSGFYKYSGGGWTDYGIDFGFQVYGSVSVSLATVSTTAASSVTSSSATLGGNVTNAGGGTVSSRGVAYSSTNSNPVKGTHPTVTMGSGTGSFSGSVTGLSAATTYYVRAWATNEAGTAYGSSVSFTTSAVAPSVTSESSSNISAISATCSGNVTSSGGASVTQRGIVYGTSTNPTTSGDKVVSGSGTGSFSANLTGLSSDQLYYWRAYAINSIGTTYGDNKTFTTKDIISHWAQSFETDSAGVLTSVSLLLRETLTSSSTAKVRLYSDDAGSPDALLASTTRVVSSGAYQWYTFTFDYDVDATTTYWVVLEDPYIVGSYYQYWGADSAGSYGAVKYSTDGSAWTAKADTTAAFKVYVQPSLTVDYDVEIDYKKRYL
jgi:hypothetical protein